MRDVTSVLLHRASAVLRNTKTKSCTLISGDFQAEQLLCSEQDVAQRQPGSHPIFSNAREKPEKPLPACRPTQDQQRASGGPARQGQTCARGRKTRPPLAVPPQPRRAPGADRSPAGHSCAPSRAPLVSHTYHAGLRQTRARRLRVTRRSLPTCGTGAPVTALGPATPAAVLCAGAAPGAPPQELTPAGCPQRKDRTSHPAGPTSVTEQEKSRGTCRRRGALRVCLAA